MNENAKDQTSKTDIGADEIRGDVIRKDDIAQHEVDPIEVPPGSEQTHFPTSGRQEASQDPAIPDKGERRDSNPDPITGHPGSHPVGAGVGAAAGGLAGAAVGSFAGPVGTVIGTAIGAVAGGYSGKGIAESLDPSEEDIFWREHHANQQYAPDGSSYDDYAPAYRTGYTNYQDDKSFEVAENDLRTHYESVPQLTNEEKALSIPGDTHPAGVASPSATFPQDSSRLIPWDQGGRDAARAAYERVGKRNAELEKNS